MRIPFRKPISVVFAASGLILSSCATSKNPNDPYENYNRKVFTFNMMMDHYILRPVTVGYVTYIPEPIRYVITNFYNNLRDFVSLGDDILQLDGMNSMQTTMRIGLNTTFGLLGMIDVASSLGLPQYKNTFGNTMKRWGWTNSSYFLVPVLGPGTVRDQLGLIPDVWFNPTWYIINDYWISGSLFVVNQIDARSKYIGQDKLLEQSLDPYATIRDIYLQHNGEYIYPTDSGESSGGESDDVDSIIADENAGTKPTKSGGDDVDALIADENAKLPAGTTTSSTASVPSAALATEAESVTPTPESPTETTPAPTTNEAQKTTTTPEDKTQSYQHQKTNLQTFDGKTVYTD